jgi:hypothetical protein
MTANSLIVLARRWRVQASGTRDQGHQRTDKAVLCVEQREASSGKRVLFRSKEQERGLERSYNLGSRRCAGVS